MAVDRIWLGWPKCFCSFGQDISEDIALTFVVEVTDQQPTKSSCCSGITKLHRTRFLAGWALLLAHMYHNAECNGLCPLPVKPAMENFDRTHSGPLGVEPEENKSSVKRVKQTK